METHSTASMRQDTLAKKAAEHAITYGYAKDEATWEQVKKDSGIPSVFAPQQDNHDYSFANLRTSLEAVIKQDTPNGASTEHATRSNAI